MAVRGALVYFVLAGAWILISTFLLASKVTRPESFALWEAGKGIAFVCVTSGVLAWVLYRHTRERERAGGELRRLTRGLLLAEDWERRRIARELHDSTAQDLVAALMNLYALRETKAARAAGLDAKLEDCAALLEKCGNDLRTLAYVLHPPRLEEAGLAGALPDYVRGFAKRTGIQTEIDIDQQIGRLPDAAELAFFRVTQECLGNIHRHAEASHARVRLRRVAEAVELEITDDGRGMPDSGLGRALDIGNGGGAGVGIPGMRERLRQIGGRLDIRSGTEGVTVCARVPVREVGE